MSGTSLNMPDKDPEFGGLLTDQASPASHLRALPVTQIASRRNEETRVVLDTSVPKSQSASAIENTQVKNKPTRRGTKTKSKSKGKPFSLRKQSQNFNAANRTEEQIAVRKILREDPEDSDALAVFQDYNPQYEGKTIEKGAGVSRNIPGTVKVDSKGRQVTIRADGSKSIKVRGRQLINLDTKVADCGNNFGRDVFEFENCGMYATLAEQSRPLAVRDFAEVASLPINTASQTMLCLYSHASM
ncbi:hypothetical protein IFR05_006071 [Cadophora sp. M221]|nr:hypothetical protein IFR05_006071 [Cadophora sp. M221]